MRTLKLALFLATLGVADVAAAYPWMIRHGYQTCAQCHVDPAGGSQITPYGRATGDLIMRTPWSDEPAEEPSPTAGFLFGAVELPEELMLGGDLRFMSVTDVQPTSDFAAFPMQADLTAGALVDRLRMSASIGYGRGPTTAAASITGDDDGRLISRHHWIGVDLGEERNWLVRAGRMYMPYGVRVPDHLLWARWRTAASAADYQHHGVSVFYGSESLRAELMAILANFQDDSGITERGYSGFAELPLGERATVGVSSSVTTLSEVDVLRNSHGLFGRWAASETVVLMAQGDYVALGRESAPDIARVVGMLMVDVEPTQGVHVAVTGENDCGLETLEGCALGGWLTLQWFFAPHADVRADMMYRRFDEQDLADGPLQIMAQLHVYL